MFMLLTDTLFQTSRKDWKSTIKILLAVHREVTMKNVYKIEENVPKEVLHIQNQTQILIS